MANLLALDQASKITGYAVFVNGTLKEYGKFEASSSELGARLTDIRNQIIGLVETYDIAEVVCEDIIHDDTKGGFENPKTFKILAEVLGVATEVINSLNIPLTILPANTWRQALGIKTGRGQKRTIVKAADIKWVLDNYNISPSEDECDAICIGAAHLKSNNSFNWD